MGESKYITCEEYEDCYREALFLLKERFKDVGPPTNWMASVSVASRQDYSTSH